jgi:hypothetical protein
MKQVRVFKTYADHWLLVPAELYEQMYNDYQHTPYMIFRDKWSPYFYQDDFDMPALYADI